MEFLVVLMFYFSLSLFILSRSNSLEILARPLNEGHYGVALILLAGSMLMAPVVWIWMLAKALFRRK